MIVGLSGYIGSGKDTVGDIIRYLNMLDYPYIYGDGDEYLSLDNFLAGNIKLNYSTWIIKKFAAKLKEVASLLTGIPKEKFEDQDFKRTALPYEWGGWAVSTIDNRTEIPELKRMSNRMGKKEAIEELVKYQRMLKRKKIEGVQSYISEYPMTVREFLQKLGTEAIRDGLHTNAWVNALFSDYTTTRSPRPGSDLEQLGEDFRLPKGGKFISKDNNEYFFDRYPTWIITDVRFPNEAEAITSRGGVIFRINRSIPLERYHTLPDGSMTMDTSKSIARHPSETSLDDWPFHEVIENDGTIPELIEKVKIVLEKHKIFKWYEQYRSPNDTLINEHN